MKKVFTILLLLISIQVCFSQTSWNLTYSFSGSQYSNLVFINSNTGYVAIDNTLQKTTNGGLNWYTDLNQTIYTIQFLNPLTGYVCTETKSLRTTNGGVKWDTINQNPYYMDMVDSLYGYAADGSIQRQLLITVDGGHNWYIKNANVPYLNYVYFFDRNYALATAYQINKPPPPNGWLSSTNNAGSNWNVMYSSPTGPPMVQRFDSTTAFAIGNNFLLKITNKGQTVQSFPVTFPHAYLNVFFVNGNTGFLAGSSGSAGIINKTTNTGLTWSNSFNYTSSFKLIYFLNDTTGFALAYNGKLFKTINGGLTGFTQTELLIPYNYYLSQNYPNPFNPTTNINYELPNSGFVTLKVFDVMGKEIETLVNEDQNAGSYSVSFNAANYPGGVYFYKIETNGFSETKKMILLK